MKKTKIIPSILSLIFLFSCADKPANWNGFKRTNLQIENRDCILIEPAKPLPANQWIWRTEFFGQYAQADSELAAKGFYVAYMDLQNMYGAPVAINLMDSFYKYLTTVKKLNTKVVLEGFSRGGLFAFNWAEKNPGKVSSIYVDAPVCDFKSWPEKNSPENWQKLKNVYGFKSDKEANDYKFNPIDNLEPLAKFNVPIIAVCGAKDTTVPMNENINIVAERYKNMGGNILIITKPNAGHHPHSLPNPKPVVDFILSFAKN